MRYVPSFFLIGAWAVLFLVLCFAGCGDDGGGVHSQDTTPPADVTDLSVVSVTESSAVLAWTAPGDDGWEGTASTYDLRRSTVRILEEAWSTRTQIAGEPSPKPAFSPETLAVVGLYGAATIHFALRAADETGNWSGVSNSAVFDEGEPRVHEVRPDGLGGFPTIQAAIDSSAEGDTILLAAGIFTGGGNRDIDFGGKALLLRSQDGSASACVIDCQGSSTEPRRAFLFHSGEETTSVVEAITVRNGNMPGEEGGAIVCDGASPFFRHCVIESCASGNGGALGLRNGAAPRFEECVLRCNDTPGWGGAVFSRDAFPVFLNCTLSDNRAFMGGAVYADGESLHFVNCRFERNEAHRGGGVLIDRAAALLERCAFTDNQTENPLVLEGGGLYMTGGRQRLTDCTFQGNRAGTGGGLYVDDCDTLAMYGNVFVANEAGANGAGMTIRLTPARIDHGLFQWNAAAERGAGMCVEDANVHLVETYFTGNEAETGAGIHHASGIARVDSCVFYFNDADDRGGGISAEDSLAVTRSTFTDNTAPSGTAIHLSGSAAPSIANTILAFNGAGDPVTAEATTAPSLSCCDVYGNAGGDWVGVIAAQAATDGNFSEDPLFCDHAGGDVHLHENSPCANRPGCGWIGLEPVGCWE
ncbi:MAG: right-handed parallel beta-helix repeat-containing protein [Candidatus Eisenbacteria bacterium]|nr:right-handed parallel beta-helix repeat-containing protein [Candidatus Eisenbacteria bacterium]